MIHLLSNVCLFISLCLLTACEKNNVSGTEKLYRFDGEMYVDGRQRPYLLNLPPSYYESHTEFALVIALHGTGGSALQFERDYAFTKKANESSFIVVYPEGAQSDGMLRLRTWNAGNCCDYALENNINDVKFISELIDELLKAYKIDPTKVYVTGMSNVGMLAYHLACEIPDKIAAIAPVSSTMMVAQPCDPSRPVPVLHIHSALDTKIPYQGGTGIGGYYYPPVDSVLQVWASINACPAPPVVVVDNAQYTLTQWQDCSQETKIQVYVTRDGGHAWAGGVKSHQRGDTPSTAIRATDLAWDLFQQVQLP